MMVAYFFQIDRIGKLTAIEETKGGDLFFEAAGEKERMKRRSYRF
ncbi:MAG: hypothetical protein ACUVWO_07115 [Thermodesulfobacteriota bacterium]